MKPEPLDVAIQAFARASAAASDGRATRARVIATVTSHQQRRARWRRSALGVLVALGLGLSASAAWTALGRWRAAPRVQAVRVATVERAATAPRTSAAASPSAPSPSAQAPSAQASSAQSTITFDAESLVYRRAHEAHFGANDPARALTAWNRYLADFPGGSFVPEARYNRALCLMRLNRDAAAVAALRPFARGAYGDYRRREATELLETLAARAARTSE